MAKTAKVAAASSDLRLRVVDPAVPSCLGVVTYVKIHADPYRPLGWNEVHQRFAEEFPRRWAVQCFPPADRLVDGKAVYHLWILPEGVTPQGLDIKDGK